MRYIILTAALIAAAPAAAQSFGSPGIPPNAIDRATARSDTRQPDIATERSIDTLAAQRDAQASRDRTLGPVDGSLFTNSVDGAIGNAPTGVPSVSNNAPGVPK